MRWQLAASQCQGHTEKETETYVSLSIHVELEVEQVQVELEDKYYIEVRADVSFLRTARRLCRLHFFGGRGSTRWCFGPTRSCS